MKKILLRILLGLGILLFLCGIYVGICRIYYETHEPETDLDVTNTNASIYEDEEEFLEELEDIFEEDFYKEILNNKDDTNESSKYNFYVIPGEESTVTINAKTKKREICTSMTPQGMAVMEKYIFISSYCHTHKHNSVIYLIDRKKGTFIKEIVLPSTSHVGGLAYDTVNNKLWVTEYKNNKAYISSIYLDKIEEYEFNKPIKYDDEILIEDLKRTSFLTYYDNNLVTGYFNLLHRGNLNVYSIKNGTMSSKSSYKKAINSKVQGIAISDDGLALSTSYGINKSKLLYFDGASIENDLTEENATEIYKLPEKLEQIYLYDNKLYMLFESSAFNYRFRSNDVIDRVITFKIYND